MGIHENSRIQNIKNLLMSLTLNKLSETMKTITNFPTEFFTTIHHDLSAVWPSVYENTLTMIHELARHAKVGAEFWIKDLPQLAILAKNDPEFFTKLCHELYNSLPTYHEKEISLLNQY